MSLQKCLLSWNESKKFVGTFLSHVLFLENVNSSSSLGCFKVTPLNPCEGDIVEVRVNDPSHHRCFKNVIKHSCADGPIVQNGLYRSWVLCCCSDTKKKCILFFAIEFNMFLNYSLCIQTNSSMSVTVSVLLLSHSLATNFWIPTDMCSFFKVILRKFCQ